MARPKGKTVNQDARYRGMSDDLDDDLDGAEERLSSAELAVLTGSDSGRIRPMGASDSDGVYFD